MRIGFLDEAGRSRDEPIIVVAGILINGDRTYRKLEDRLREISEIIPRNDRNRFIFHAKDLFHGNRYFKDHKIWPRESRYKILHSIALIPKNFGIPVIFGHTVKDEYREEIKDTLAHHKTEKQRQHDADVAEHMNTFAMAEITMERQMQTYSRDEICMLIAEDTDRVKKAVKSAHAFLRDPDRIKGTEFEGTPGLPLRKIVDTPHFAEKAESAPLQVADVCAYLILRRLMRRVESQEFFEDIAPQLIWNAADFAEPMGIERVGQGSVW